MKALELPVRDCKPPRKLLAGNGVWASSVLTAGAPTFGGKPMILRKLVYTLGLLAVLGSSLVLVACNTIEGAGQDTSAAGRAVSDTAK